MSFIDFDSELEKQLCVALMQDSRNQLPEVEFQAQHNAEASLAAHILGLKAFNEANLQGEARYSQLPALRKSGAALVHDMAALAEVNPKFKALSDKVQAHLQPLLNENTLEERLKEAVTTQTGDDHDEDLSTARFGAAQALHHYVQVQKNLMKNAETPLAQYHSIPLRRAAQTLRGELQNLAALDNSVAPVVAAFEAECESLLVSRGDKNRVARKAQGFDILASLRAGLNVPSSDPDTQTRKAAALKEVLAYEKLLTQRQPGLEALQEKKSVEMMHALQEVHQIDPAFGDLYYQAHERFVAATAQRSEFARR